MSLAVLALALPWTAGICLAQAPLREDPDKVLDFARQLQAEGDAYRAVTECQAFLFLFPGHARAPEAWFLMGQGLGQEGQWGEAVQAYRQSLQLGGAQGPWSPQAAMALGEALLKAGQPASAGRLFEELGRSPHWPGLRASAMQRAAWAWMEAREWDHAVAVLKEVPPGDPFHASALRLGQEIRDGISSLPRRDPWVAGGLAAVIPGSGHLYAGRVKDAVASFLLNGLFIAGAVVAIRDGYPITGGILSFFELGWYLGGIETAAKSAAQFNREQESRWLGSLADRWGLAMSFEPARDAGEVRLAWRF
jgi:hypothetical protein